MGFHEIMLDEHSKYDTDDVSNILEIDSLPKLDTINPEKLNFHTSWDWLMPVVSKITRDEILIGNEYRESIMDTAPYGLIEDTYKAVVQFIEYYNNTNK